VPSGTGHSQSSPWTSALALDHWIETSKLNVVVGQPTSDVQFLPASADFNRHFPHMSAVGTRQHPQQGPLLDPGLGGGGGDGGDSEGGGSGGGASTRPSSGLLWPRRS
jgi:hypothetical protein